MLPSWFRFNLIAKMLMERRKKSNKFLHVCAYQTVVFLLFSLISSYKAIELVAAAADHSSFLPLSISEIIVLFWEECAWTHDSRVSHDHHRTAWPRWRQRNPVSPENNGRDDGCQRSIRQIRKGRVDCSAPGTRFDESRARSLRKQRSEITENLIRSASHAVVPDDKQFFKSLREFFGFDWWTPSQTQFISIRSIVFISLRCLHVPAAAGFCRTPSLCVRGMKTNRSEIMIATSHGVLRGRCVMDWFVCAIKKASIKWPPSADRPQQANSLAGSLTRIFNCHPTLQD